MVMESSCQTVSQIVKLKSSERSGTSALTQMELDYSNFNDDSISCFADAQF